MTSSNTLQHCYATPAVEQYLFKSRWPTNLLCSYHTVTSTSKPISCLTLGKLCAFGDGYVLERLRLGNKCYSEGHLKLTMDLGLGCVLVSDIYDRSFSQALHLYIL